MKHTRVLIVDDYAIVRKGLQMIIDTEAGIQIVGEAKNSQDAVSQAKNLQPDVILMDLLIPPDNSVEAIAEIRRLLPTVKIIVLTAFEDTCLINTALEAGADGYLLKNADAGLLLKVLQVAGQQNDGPFLSNVIHHLIKGRVHDSTDSHLTGREKEILRLVARGVNNRAIADALNLSENTVKVHMRNIFIKLDVSSRTEAVTSAIRLKLI